LAECLRRPLGGAVHPAVYRDYLTLPAAETLASLLQKHIPAVMLSASSYTGRDIVANSCASRLRRHDQLRIFAQISAA
jgi:hypothetical protein